LAALAAAAHLGFTPLSGGVLLPSLEDAVGVDDLFSSLFSQEAKVVHEAIGNEHFDDDVPYDSGGSDHNADEMLMIAERNQLESLTAALNDEQLQQENANDDRDEKVVVENVGEYV
jgi:hypothetical protein